jgi:hypothetical protein
MSKRKIWRDVMKKSLIILFLFISLNVFAEDGENNVDSEQETVRNSISGGINIHLYFFVPIPGLSLEYERLLGKIFSVGLEVGTILFFEPYFIIRGRIYPFSGMFFTGLSWGLWSPSLKYSMYYQMISVELGWKIDMKKDKWFLMPSILAGLIGPEINNNTIHGQTELRMEMFLLKLDFKIGYKF